MSLFQNSVLNKYLKGLESEKVNQAYERFISHFHNPSIQENIRNSKEEQYQGEFLIDLFVNVLGYTKNPTPDFNLTTELKNITGSKKTDGAILKGEKALAVIELKGTNTTDLSKVETQAFGYKNNQTGCNYVITSNFEKLRFYIDNAVDFEEFNLFQLSKERFDILWLCLSSEYLLKDIPKKIKDESLTQEENVTKKLYKDYASFRNEIFDAIQKENPEYGKLTLFKKTQKLLDRFLFIFFAEDRLLLPPNSIRSILNQWADLRDKYDEYFPLYNRFKKYFGYMNTGHKGQQHDIFAYNGGLFAPDEILDNIKINDELLYKHTLNLSNYDFESEVSVNILGHIFEHSLNDIDEIQAEIQGVATDQSKTKRKKDGVFYTPKYITKYIVDNTVGKLCEEKKTELDIQEAEYEKERKGRKSTTLKNLTQKLEDYRKWLLQITICDPACGSGAFLNQALEFLIAEHQYIDELQAKLFGDAMVLSEVENAILENNIYGVDINEESVEIAKLSLWLRTAQKGRKLTSLNNNIKCGNSLIEDPEVAGDKAFNWHKEFPEVFAKGGFDVVIGNPPYVRVQNLDYLTIDFYKTNYDVCHQRVDLYLLFFEKGFTILNNKGILSYINPTMFINSDYGIGLRKFLKNTGILEIVDFGDLSIFADAITYTGIFTISKEKKSDFDYVKFDELIDLPNDLSNKSRIKIEIKGLSDEGWIYSSKEEKKILEKLETKIKLSDIAIINSGCFTGYDEAFFVDNNDINDYNLEKDLIFPVIMGKEPKRYSLNPPIKKAIYPYVNSNGKTELISEEALKNYPNTYNYLLKNKEKLLQRKDSRKTFKEMGRPWYSYTRKGLIEVFESDKILVGYIVNDNTYCLDDDKFIFSVGRVFGIVPQNNSLKFGLLGLLNSKVSKYLMKLKCPIKKGGYFKISSKYLSEFTILSEKHLLTLTDIVKEQINTNNIYNQNIENLLNLLINKFNINSSKKLETWHELEFGDFLKELEKARKKSAKENETEYSKLSLSEEAEWMQYFKEQKQKATELKAEIDKTDKEIDQMVYELYGLTDEEIAIVEDSTR